MNYAKRALAAIGRRISAQIAFKTVEELCARVAELEARLSVADGRSTLNAERIVRTHSSLQNMAEDLDPVTKNVNLLMSERTTGESATSGDS